MTFRPGLRVAEPAAIVLVDDGRILGGGQLFALRLARWLLEQDGKHPAPTIACPADSELAARSREAGIPVRDIRFPDPAIGSVAPRPRGGHALGDRAAGGARLGRDRRRQRTARAGVRRAGSDARPAPAGHREPRARAGHGCALVGAIRARARRARGRRRSQHGGGVRGGAPWTAYRHINNFLAPEEVERAAASGAARTTAQAPPVVGVLARLIPEKGLLEGFHELLEGPDAWSELHIAGEAQDPVYAERLRAAVDDAGMEHRVSLLGRVDDLPRFFADVDVLLVPSTGHEAQPTVILEALAYGRPVIVRSPIWSKDFDGLPVRPYATAAELAAALRSGTASIDAADLRSRFGPEQALDGLLDAASGRR